MSEQLLLSLWITIIGMGIVFAAIVVLWVAMALLVSATRIVSHSSSSLDEAFSSVEPEDETSRKAKAASAAVAYLLEKSKQETKSQAVFPLPPTAIVSAWQAVMRSNIFSKRGRVR